MKERDAWIMFFYVISANIKEIVNRVCCIRRKSGRYIVIPEYLFRQVAGRSIIYLGSPLIEFVNKQFILMLPNPSAHYSPSKLGGSSLLYINQSHPMELGRGDSREGSG